jgi:tRNA A37 threonylcarbamoyladenosine synthetase subunit TsaC/SUA5/YrdC
VSLWIQSAKKPRLEHATVTTIQPTVAGVLEVARRWRKGDAVAIPTECTYEVYWQGLLDRCHVRPCYLLMPASARHPFLTHILPPRLYAMRGGSSGASSIGSMPSPPAKSDDTETSVSMVHKFSEAQEVLTKIAAKVWPGPMTIQVSCDPHKSTCIAPLLTMRHVTPFVTLRSPCHPLAVKVTHDVLHPPQSSSSSLTATLLMGTPLHTHNVEYCCSAEAVEQCMGGVVDAVLHGEEQREIFAVPTCEHQRPWPMTVVVDATRRVVTLQGHTPVTSLCPVLGVTAVGLRQALVERVSSSATASALTPSQAVKDRLIRSVLAKWTVVEEPGAVE